MRRYARTVCSRGYHPLKGDPDIRVNVGDPPPTTPLPGWPLQKTQS